jgi:hypothetical protein
MSQNRVPWWTIVPPAVLALCGACRSAPALITPELVARNNHAVGLMGQFDFDAAVNAFEALEATTPEWPGARLNLAIALMNRQRSGDAARAEPLLRGLLDSEPVARRARFTLGLLLVHEGREDEALPLLTGVATGTPPDGFAAYFVGQIRLSTSAAEALEWYRRALAAEPLLRSAHYGAFMALRRLNREDEAAVMLSRFQELERHPQAMIAEFKYTRMGPLSEALTVDASSETPPIAPEGPRFLAATPLVPESGLTWRRDPRLRSITVADIDGDGALDVFIAGAFDDDSPNAVLLGRGGGFALDRAHPLARLDGVRAALWGDLNDDGLVDVVLCRFGGGTRIWRQASAGRWSDGIELSGGGLSRTDCIDGALFDADHDGDLDIWLVNVAGTNELLNNDGNGRLRAIGATAGVTGEARPSVGLAVTDLDGDRDADVVVIKTAPPHDVFLNGRVWDYRRDQQSSELADARISAIVAGDLDADGEVELFSSNEDGLQRWRRDADSRWRREPLVTRASSRAPARLSIADTDGDGALEVIESTAEGWTVYEPSRRAPGWTAVQLADTQAPHGWAVAHLDPARGPSVIGVRGDGVPVIWKPGRGRWPYLSLAFTGRDPSSDQRRSNASGMGTRVTVRTGSRWTAFENTRLESGPGQSLQPTAIGLGGAPRADFVALTWSDGVFQTELALDAGRLHRIAETQRQLSSCPVLFAWDGSRFRFVTDVLGVGGIGFFERPGVYSAPYPREHVLLPAGVTASVAGTYRLKLAEPMEEITYLDRAALVAYDLPPGWQMALDERKAISGPAPTGAPIFYREERRPVSAVNDAGEDVTARLADADLHAAGPEAVDPRFIGLARPYSVTLAFDRAIDRGPGAPWLVIDGWVEYPYAQTMFAAWQAGATYEAPTIEARDAGGRWHTVAREFGYPAGMPRRMTFPLPRLPRDTTALRLRTTQEIYWDRIAIVYAEPLPAARRQALPLRDARLASGGVAPPTTGPPRPPP